MSDRGEYDSRMVSDIYLDLDTAERELTDMRANSGLRKKLAKELYWLDKVRIRG